MPLGGVEVLEEVAELSCFVGDLFGDYLAINTKDKSYTKQRDHCVYEVFK